MTQKKLVEHRKKLAELLKKRRLELNLTQEEVGKVCGWDKQSIYRIEKGVFYIGYKQLLLLCNALSLEINFIKKEVNK